MPRLRLKKFDLMLGLLALTRLEVRPHLGGSRLGLGRTNSNGVIVGPTLMAAVLTGQMGQMQVLVIVPIGLLQLRLKLYQRKLETARTRQAVAIRSLRALLAPVIVILTILSVDDLNLS